MFEIAGGIFIAVIALFVVLPISTIILGLILSYVLNAITPNDIISDAAANICMFIGFIISSTFIILLWQAWST